MKQHKLFTLLLAVALVLSLGVAALAADITQTITLTAPAEQLTVTVPTRLDLALTSEDGILHGSTLGDESAQIVNGSSIAIQVEEIKVDLADNWGFVGSETDINSAQQAAMTIGGTSVKDAAPADLAKAIGTNGKIDANASADLNCELWLRTGQYIPADLVSVTYTIGWAD